MKIALYGTAYCRQIKSKTDEAKKVVAQTSKLEC